MVAAGTLIVTQSSAIAANTSLTVGAGGVLIFSPSSGGTLSPVVAVATPATASSADTTTASTATSGVTSVETAAVATNVVWSSVATFAAPMAGVLDARAADQIAGSSMPSRHTALLQSRDVSREREWAWLGQSTSSFDNSDQGNKKDIAIQALETVFAQYGP